VESPTRVATSSAFFESVQTCIGDAKLHGFDAKIDSELEAFTQSAYTFRLFEDGTVTFSPEA
jgi:hypothetical protein